MNILATLLLQVIPMDAHLVQETCACVERNHYFDGDGRLVFSQFVFWDWDGRHNVAAWRLEKDEFRFHPPIVTWSENDRVRQVRGAYWRESWTQYDPELAERREGFKRRELRR